jgi:WD40 repeat protein
MKIPIPQFELTRVLNDGSEEKPQIVPVTSIPDTTQMSRRGFFGVGLTAAAALGLLTACRTDPHKRTYFHKWSLYPAGHKSLVSGLSITPDSQIVVSGSWDGYVKYWSLPEGQLLKSIYHGEKVRSVVVTPDGQAAISGGSGDVIIWTLPSGVEIQNLAPEAPGFPPDVHALAVSMDGRWLVGRTENRLILWNLTTRPRRFSQLAETDNSGLWSGLAITSDQNPFLFSGSTEDSVSVWRVISLTAENVIKNLRDYGRVLAVTPDGKILVSGSLDGEVCLTDWKVGKVLARLEGHSEPVWSLAITPDGVRVFSGSADRTIKQWNIQSGKLERTLTGQEAVVASLAVTPNGKYLLSGDATGIIIVWDLNTGNKLAYLFDKAATKSTAQGLSYNVYDKITGRTVTYTMPCGSPIPPDATCVCNCVPGTISPPSSDPKPSSYGYTYCSCDKVCTCVPVYR